MSITTMSITMSTSITTMTMRSTSIITIMSAATATTMTMSTATSTAKATSAAATAAPAAPASQRSFVPEINIITAATIGMLFFSLVSYPIAPINTLLQKLGILNTPFEYFRNAPTSRGIVSFIQWWMWYGNTMIIMIAGIMGINPALFEAALVDGCSSRQTFWKITLPLIKPILLYNLVTSLVGGLTMFDIPHLMTQGNPNYTTNTVARFIYQQGFEAPNNFNMASAASVVLFGIIVVCSLILSALMKDRDAKPAKGVGK